MDKLIGCIQHDCAECKAREVQQTTATNMKSIQAARTLLRACANEFSNAAAKGRLTDWANMAHSIVDLLAAEDIPRAKEPTVDCRVSSYSAEEPEPDPPEPLV